MRPFCWLTVQRLQKSVVCSYSVIKSPLTDKQRATFTYRHTH